MNEEVKMPQENNEKHVRNNDAKRPNRRPRKTFDKPKSDLEEKVICINRVTKVVKGGRQFRFAATVVVGNRKGKVGIGLGKAKEMPDAVKKATQAATKNLITSAAFSLFLQSVEITYAQPPFVAVVTSWLPSNVGITATPILSTISG